MKESISYTYLLNMMLVFIIVSFCVILATISYSKAYRVNSKIANALEVAEGYNALSAAEIDRLIRAFGYQQLNVDCSEGETGELIEGTVGYCLYEIEEDDYYYYSITTYMLFDFPIINRLRLPVRNNSEKIYNFDGGV